MLNQSYSLNSQISIGSFVLVSSDNRGPTDPRGQRACFGYSPKLCLLYNMTTTSAEQRKSVSGGTPICSAERCPLTFDVRFMCLGALLNAV